MTPPAVLKWIQAEAATLQVPEVYGVIREMEFDEMRHFIGTKKQKMDHQPKALDRATGRTVAWVLGGRDTATFRRLYDKVKHLADCRFYTDDWDTFASVPPKDRHVIGKQHTVAIELGNSNTRHHLGRTLSPSR